jgi:hypothetical protein
MHRIYSTQRTGFDKSKYNYANPKFFTRPQRKCTQVTIVGDYPHIEKAYQELSIPVQVISECLPYGQINNIIDGVPVTKLVDAETVEIPDNWKELHWKKKVSLAGKLSTQHCVNALEAEIIILAELERRNGVRS